MRQSTTDSLEIFEEKLQEREAVETTLVDAKSFP
jgi:hypothetical protein